MTYAIVKTGGKQYRVEEGQTLLVERLPAAEGDKVGLEPLLYRDDDSLLHGDELGKVAVEAKVLAHERGPKLHVLKFKPKRGYKRRTGHRQELTRLEVTAISGGGKAGAKKPAAEKKSAAAEKKPATAKKPDPEKKPAAAKKPAAEKKPAAAKKPAATKKPAAKKPEAKAKAKPKPKPRTRKTSPKED